MLLALGALATGAGAATPAATTAASGVATVTVIATLMSVGSATGGASGAPRALGASVTASEVTITGEPGQLYRVSVGSPPGYRATFWSANSGALGSSHLGRLSPRGRDTLHIAVAPVAGTVDRSGLPSILRVMVSGE